MSPCFVVFFEKMCYIINNNENREMISHYEARLYKVCKCNG